jgi:adenosyl cobinamide kinase/adenosyl cobinamide phosphate guanylyltransferase
MALTLLIGGARSGKSALALRRARSHGGPVVFVATAEPRDTEMAGRIARHRDERPASWTTVEAPLDLVGALEGAPAHACVIVDCLSLWVANLMEQGKGDEAVLHDAREAGRLAAARPAPTIAVTNEVGLGVVPASALGRRYRDLLGQVNAAWADLAPQAALVVAGRPLLLMDGELG